MSDKLYLGCGCVEVPGAAGSDVDERGAPAGVYGEGVGWDAGNGMATDMSEKGVVLIQTG